MKDEGLKVPDSAPKKKATTPDSGTAKKVTAKKSPATRVGEYVVEQGDYPWSVGLKLYGDGQMGREIATKNPDSHWEVGDVLSLP